MCFTVSSFIFRHIKYLQICKHINFTTSEKSIIVNVYNSIKQTQVDFLTNSILNTCKNFIPNKIISIRDKEAPWMTVGIKRVLLEKAKIYRKYVKK